MTKQLDIDHLSTIETIARLAPFAGNVLNLCPIANDAKRYIDAVCEIDPRLSIREHALPADMKAQLLDEVEKVRASLEQMHAAYRIAEPQPPRYLIDDNAGVPNKTAKVTEQRLAFINNYIEAYVEAAQ